MRCVSRAMGVSVWTPGGVGWLGVWGVGWVVLVGCVVVGLFLGGGLGGVFGCVGAVGGGGCGGVVLGAVAGHALP